MQSCERLFQGRLPVASIWMRCGSPKRLDEINDDDDVDLGVLGLPVRMLRMMRAIDV